MENVLISFLFIFIAVVFSIVTSLPLIYVRNQRRNSNYLVDSTEETIERLGLLVKIVGPVRTGKTLLMVLMAHAKIRIFIKKIDNELSKIIKMFPKFDFLKINESIDEYLSINDYNLNEIYSILFSKIKGITFDYLNIYSVEKQFKNYISYYYILNFRNQYMMSNFFVFCRETLTPSKQLDKAALELKNLKLTKAYNLTKALVILIDEVSIDSSNSKSNSKVDKDTGEKELNILIGQIFEELTMIISTKQVVIDEIVTTRRLQTALVDVINSREIIYDFKVFQYIIDKILSFHKFIFELPFMFIIRKSKRYELIDRAYLKINWYRRKENFWNSIKTFLVSEGVIVVKANITFSGITTPEEKTMFYWVKDGYGAYDTHERSCVREELESNYSKATFEQSPDNRRFADEKKKKDLSSFLRESPKTNEEREVVFNEPI